MSTDLSDDEFDPPSPERVAARSLVLASVSCRGLIEIDAGEAGAEELRVRVQSWVRSLGIVQEAESSELELLDTPLGELSNREAIDASWVSEGLVVLAWALGAAQLPVLSEQCNPSDVADQLGFLDDRAATPIAQPSLLDPSEIEAWADSYLTVHWRLRQFSIDPKAIDLTAYVESCEWGPLSVERLELSEGDLAVGGVRIDRASDTDVRLLTSVVQERHHAFNWLLGFEPLYSQVTTDT